MDKELVNKLEKVAKEVRGLCLDIAFEKNPRATHLGGALSSIEILVTLYFGIMKFDPKNPTWEDRDRFFLSKGHSILGYYITLCKAGFFSIEQLYTYGNNGTLLPGHPVINKKMGIEFTNGSLGLGLAVAIGHAIAAKRKGKSYKTFVLMGDGECNEGSVWEGAMAAPHFNLDNLTAIVDRNGYQQTGAGVDIMKNNNLREKFASFGWEALEIDGHSPEEIYRAMIYETTGKPRVIIANTIKGKGFSFTEGNNSWHHGVMTKELYQTGLQEMGTAND